MYYSMKARNELNANRIEAYLQDTYRFTSGGILPQSGDIRQTRYTLNYGLRLSHWNFNRETILSPRVSLAIIPANTRTRHYRFAAGLLLSGTFLQGAERYL